MVSMLAVPLPVGTTLYQIVLALPAITGVPGTCEHVGIGSCVPVVAPELPLGSLNEAGVIFIAAAQLTFAGPDATPLQVGKLRGCVVTVVPRRDGEC